MGCNQCNKTTACTCGCDVISSQENCNDCINQASIAFSGLCDPNQFNLDNNNWKGFNITGTIGVPEEKYSIEEIDSISSKVEILSKRLISTPTSTLANYEGKMSTGKKLIVEGLLCLAVSYVALNPEQSVNSFHGQVPFSVFIVMPANIDTSYDYLIDSCIEDLCIKKVCERTIDISACIVVKATPIPGGCTEIGYDNSGLGCSGNVGFSMCKQDNCFKDNPVVTGVCPINVVTSLLGSKDQQWTEVSIPEVLTIPDAKPDILQILSIVSRVEIMCQKVIATPSTGTTPPAVIKNYSNTQLTGFKLLIHGLLRQRITYTSTSECKSVHSAHYDIPICLYIVLPTTTDFTDKFKITPCIEDIYACALNNRQIFKNTTLFIKADLLECEEV